MENNNLKENMLDNSSYQDFNRGLLNNSIKLMNGKHGGAFYVRYLFDESTGQGWLQLTLEYPDGTLIGILLCKNVCIIKDEERGIDGVGEVETGYGPQNELPPGLRGKKQRIIPRLKNSLSYGEYSKFIRYERPDFSIPMDVLWNRIIELWEKIPMERWTGSFKWQEVYQVLLDIGENKGVEYVDNECVYLTRKEIEEVAIEMGYDFNSIRESFELRKLWYKDKGSLGYQRSKKINGQKYRFYALRKTIPLDKYNKPTEEYTIDYTDELPKKEIKTPIVPNN